MLYLEETDEFRAAVIFAVGERKIEMMRDRDVAMLEALNRMINGAE